MRRRIVKKFQYERVPLERLLNDAALYAQPAAMDEPDLSESGCVCFVDVLFDNRRDVRRRKCVEIEGALDGDAERVLILHRYVEAGLS
jgi:hypothetical protein